MKDNKPEIWNAGFLDVTEYILTGPTPQHRRQVEESPRSEPIEVKIIIQQTV